MIARRVALKRSYIKRKPQVTRTVQRGEREICYGQAWQDRRKEAHERALGCCERMGCGKTAPLHNLMDDRGVVWCRSGEAHHKRRRGLGGGTRNDALVNLEWLCWRCHAAAHVPAKVVPPKR